jgi:site-specific DNA-cytosine methylase
MKESLKIKTCGIFHSFAGHWQLIVERMGLKTLWYYENEKKTREIIEHNRPKLNIITDITEIPIDKTPDMIFGSPPCVGMSQANPKACIDHPANVEMQLFADTVERLKPKMFVMEMVPTLLQNRFRPLYSNLISTFLDAGYIQSTTKFNYKDYKVPQNRERVFIYGCLNKFLFFPRPTGTSNLKEAFKGLKNHSAKYVADNKLAVVMKPEWKGPYSMFINNPEYFNLKWKGISKVITAIGSGYLRHPDKHRRITYREAARLMEFPDEYDFSIHSLSSIFRDIGWGVPIKGTADIVELLIKSANTKDLDTYFPFNKVYLDKGVDDYF